MGQRFTGRTVDDALTKASVELGMTSDRLECKVIEKGSDGFLGFGRKDAVIEVTIKAEPAPEPVKVEKPVESVEPPKPDKTEESVKQEAPEEPQPTISEQAVESDRAATALDQEPADVERTASAIDNAEAAGELQKPEKRRRNNNKKKLPLTEEEREAERQAKEQARLRRFENEKPLDPDEVKKKATDFLMALFGAMELEVELILDYDDETHTLSIDMHGPEMGIIIGKRGATLDSLQYLTNLAINKRLDSYVRVKMDTEDYRKRRKSTLENLAKNVAYKVKRTRRPISLEAMNPYERRIIHYALQHDTYVTTYSEGEEPFRHVVVALK